MEAFDLAKWVSASTLQSGVPLKVEDKKTLQEIAGKLQKQVSC